jgi:hypothetical protein
MKDKLILILNNLNKINIISAELNSQQHIKYVIIPCSCPTEPYHILPQLILHQMAILYD